MSFIWTVLAVLVLVAGLRHRQRINARRRGASKLNDADIERIIQEGRLPAREEENLDLKEAAEAEDEFWDEYWDEPEEYGS